MLDEGSLHRTLQANFSFWYGGPVCASSSPSLAYVSPSSSRMWKGCWSWFGWEVERILGELTFSLFNWQLSCTLPPDWYVPIIPQLHLEALLSPFSFPFLIILLSCKLLWITGWTSCWTVHWFLRQTWSVPLSD